MEYDTKINTDINRHSLQFYYYRTQLLYLSSINCSEPAVKADQCGICGFSFTLTPRRYSYCKCTPIVFYQRAMSITLRETMHQYICHNYPWEPSLQTVRGCRLRCVGPSFRCVCLRWHAVTTPTHPLSCSSEEKKGGKMRDLSGFWNTAVMNKSAPSSQCVTPGLKQWTRNCVTVMMGVCCLLFFRHLCLTGAFTSAEHLK